MAAGGLKALVWLLVVMGALAACEGDKPPRDGPPDFSDCGLPKRHPKADDSLIPAPLLLDGAAQVARTELQQGRVIAALNVPYGVGDSFGLYKKALKQTDLHVLQEDNEGFEAELYLQSGKELGSLQIRSSTCDDAVVVYLNLPAP